MVRGGRRRDCLDSVTITAMDTTWWVGMLPAGVENVQTVAAGTEANRAAAVDRAVDTLAIVACHRGRQEYRLTVTDTQMIAFPGLTVDGYLSV
jgi:hypothetical protein